MLWSIINEADIFYSAKSMCQNNTVRSSNPYSYIRTGYHLDNAYLFGGIDDVDFNSNISGDRTGIHLGVPVSESGHSVIFHNFSGRFTNACSQLTGVIHIGIAIGLFIAFYKLFISLFKNFSQLGTIFFIKDSI